MKYPYYIITDATSDLPAQFYEEEFAVIPMTYVIDGKVYGDKEKLTSHEFFERMRGGAMPTTSLINTSTAIDFFTPFLQAGHDIFFICFSSNLSGTYKSMLEAKEELSEKFPDRRLYILDSRCAACGEGLLNYYCLKKRREGFGFEQLIDFAEDFKYHCRHDFTVDDIMHLYRGGRVSYVAALAGTAIKIKPIFIVNPEGRLIPISKVVGRKNALKALIDKMEEKTKGYDNSELVIIEHGDCMADALWVKDKIHERFGYDNILICDLGPVIGSHTGPDMLLISYVAADREK